MRLLRVDAQQESALDARLVGRWNDAVVADGQVVSPAHLSQVDVVGLGHWPMCLEEFAVENTARSSALHDIKPFHLK